jgi:hypothetical protein
MAYFVRDFSNSALDLGEPAGVRNFFAISWSSSEGRTSSVATVVPKSRCRSRSFNDRKEGIACCFTPEGLI